MLPENDKLYLKDKKTFDKISEELFKKLDYSEKPNKQLIITFSGVPCSGKSYISEKIKQRYKGIKIDSDEIMKINSQNKIVNNTQENEKLKNLYIYSFLRELPLKNKLVILDKSFDREYENFFRVCKENNLDYFIIQIEISKEKMIKRINERNSNNLENWLPRVNKWMQEHRDFKKNVKPDLMLNGENPNFKKLYNEIDKLVN
jgi:dephospho-CoA kinase